MASLLTKVVDILTTRAVTLVTLLLICLKPDYSIGWIFFKLWAKLASSNLKTSQQMTYPLFYLPTKTDTIAEITTSHLLYYIS